MNPLLNRLRHGVEQLGGGTQLRIPSLSPAPTPMSVSRPRDNHGLVARAVRQAASAFPLSPRQPGGCGGGGGGGVSR